MGVYTVGRLLDLGYSLTAYCTNLDCRHQATINLEAFPQDMDADKLTRTCSVCDARGTAIVAPIMTHPRGNTPIKLSKDLEQASAEEPKKP